MTGDVGTDAAGRTRRRTRINPGHVSKASQRFCFEACLSWFWNVAVSCYLASFISEAVIYSNPVHVPRILARMQFPYHHEAWSQKSKA